VHVLFATSELSPVASVGGLAVAAAGLVRALRDEGVEVTVALPDYGDIPLVERESLALDVPEWAGPAMARRGTVAGVGPLTLVRSHAIARPHPYNRDDGTGWPDNDRRFFAFSAAVAALTAIEQPDVLHLNDWHTSTVLAFGWPLPPAVLTIHNLAYQGWADVDWLLAFPHYREAFHRDGACNPLVGGIRLADAVITVSPTYAREILTEAEGMGLEDELQARGSALIGILNGIDTAVWDPGADAHLPATYTWPDLAGKAVCRKAALDRMGLPELDRRSGGPLITVVSRLVQQKGVDLLLPLVRMLHRLPAQLAILGDGDADLARALQVAAASAPERMAFRRGYDEGLSHLLFGGGDLLAMPSRFEPCGLAQMQAMRYGTLPVVTDVGGLHDTVVDIDDRPGEGTGTVAAEPSTLAMLDALHRGVRAHSITTRRQAMQRRGMRADWSWAAPARQHIDLYRQLIGGAPP
jgi:starch synthase